MKHGTKYLSSITLRVGLPVLLAATPVVMWVVHQNGQQAEAARIAAGVQGWTYTQALNAVAADADAGRPPVLTRLSENPDVRDARLSGDLDAAPAAADALELPAAGSELFGDAQVSTPSPELADEAWIPPSRRRAYAQLIEEPAAGSGEAGGPLLAHAQFEGVPVSSGNQPPPPGNPNGGTGGAGPGWGTLAIGGGLGAALGAIAWAIHDAVSDDDDKSLSP